MKRLRLIEGFRYWGEKKPSKSFIRKLSESLTKQIEKVIDLPFYKENFTDIIELSFDTDYLYDVTLPLAIAMEVRAKNTAFIVCNFCVVWNGEDIYPWDDISEKDIKFKMLFPKNEIDKLNYLLSELYAPIICGAESGLPYDYQISTRSTDGKLVFELRQAVSAYELQKIDFYLRNFFEHYNRKSDLKIHDVGQIRVLKSGKIRVDIDFGSCSSSVIEACIVSFRKLNFIKKIQFV